MLAYPQNSADAWLQTITREYAHRLLQFLESWGGLAADFAQDHRRRQRHALEAPSPAEALSLWTSIHERVPVRAPALEFAKFLDTRPPLGLGGRLFMHAPTLGEGLQRAFRLPAYVADFRLRLARTEEWTCLALVRDGGPRSASYFDRLESAAILAHLLQLLRRSSQRFLTCREVRLRHPSPERREDFDCFFGTPVIFDSPDDSFVIARDLETLPHPQADTLLGEYLHQYSKKRFSPPAQTNDRVHGQNALVTPTECRLQLIRLLRDNFQLTVAEAELGSLLLAGKTVRQAAQLRQTSERTARHQLQSIFRKTGTSRQSEFVRRAMSLPMDIA